MIFRYLCESTSSLCLPGPDFITIKEDILFWDMQYLLNVGMYVKEMTMHSANFFFPFLSHSHRERDSFTSMFYSSKYIQ